MQSVHNFTEDNELIKMIKALDVKTRRSIKISIEGMWAQEDDDAADPAAPPPLIDDDE